MSSSTEPNTGLETLKLRTMASRDGDHYKISGQKMQVLSKRSAAGSMAALLTIQ